MTDCHRKSGSSMFTKFTVGVIHQNFTHSHFTILRFYLICNDNYNVDMHIVQGEE